LAALVIASGRPFWNYLRSIAALVLLWYLVSRWIANPNLMPGPEAALPQLRVIAETGELWKQVTISMRRLVIGYSLAAVAGLTLGVLMTLVRPVEMLADPVIELVRPVSGIAWIPLFLVLFGVGDVLPILVIFYAAFFPFVVNTYAAFRRIPPNLIGAAQTLGAGSLTLAREVIIPAALPSVLTGARIALGFAWASIVAAELIGSASGIGFSIEWNRQLLHPDRVLAWIAVVGMLGFLTDRAALWLERRLTPWARPSGVEMDDGR
jgi:ABC-type nitrate/sulfonate/bicarbonate transport system permease component